MSERLKRDNILNNMKIILQIPRHPCVLTSTAANTAASHCSPPLSGGCFHRLWLKVGRGTRGRGPGDACLGKWDTGTRQIGDAWGREIGDACYIAEKRKKYYVVL